MPTAGGDQKSQRESLILEGHGFSRAANSTALAGEIGLGNRGLIGDSFLRALPGKDWREPQGALDLHYALLRSG
jgi:hypothetical protein